MAKQFKIGLAIILVVAGAVTTVALLLQHGFSARDQPTAIEAFVARRLRHLAVPRSARQAKLVHFIRHLPKLSPEELEEMKKLNPKSPHELEEEEEIEQFLQGEDGPATQPQSHH